MSGLGPDYDPDALSPLERRAMRLGAFYPNEKGVFMNDFHTVGVGTTIIDEKDEKSPPAYSFCREYLIRVLQTVGYDEITLRIGSEGLLTIQDGGLYYFIAPRVSQTEIDKIDRTEASRE